jgi:hypothetical protein
MTVGYSDSLKQTVMKAPKSIGNQIGRWAVHLNFSVARISKSTGASRQTVYNWITGGQVTYAYQERAKILLEILRGSSTAEQAWKRVCQRFNLKT